MGQIADELKSLTIKVTSPDANISGTLNGRDVAFRFRPDTYRSYRERNLEHQFGRLLTLMATGYRRGHGQIMDRAGLVQVVKPEDARDEAQRLYFERLADMTVFGGTKRNLVRFKATGMRGWECRIEDGALAKLTEQQCVVEAEAAIHRLITEYRRELMFLRDECFDLGIPAIRARRKPMAVHR